ncbi:SDR family oxidoreductase [Erythrobacter sp. AP23]|uniref:SDR family oxidoreductase n=1 Tax=Erythrobacter sp. AP23 TaxID=499656 RepID=UPI00076C50A0|nr:SDR family oxidoreductase [Erythrobacter sp. AP23]KWV94044.1 hypothetical protein ASS64_09300 [Erythrobacter sp. AP23]
MAELKGKTALITGASRGIGRAIALRLASDGANIAINYHSNSDAAKEVADQVRGMGVRASDIVGDIAQIGSIPSIFDAVESEFGGVDILVNNAGVMAMGPFESLDEGDFDKMFAITKGVYYMMREASRRLNDGGNIINLSTGLTRNWAPKAAGYAGSKAAIEQFTRSLSKEVGVRGIAVNAILPGVTETDMTSNFPEERKLAASAQTSFGRLGRPEDIADVVSLLVDRRARWITGQLIVANGGSTP